MALKFKFKSKDEIPAEHLALYAERDGAWLLDVEGAVEKAKLEEVRTTNVALVKERDELKQRFAGIDPDEVKTLAEEKRINTFLRLASPGVIAKLREAFPDLPEQPDAKTVFLKLRELRNSW